MVDSYKYLGVKINSKLSWNERIAEVSIKASHVLNLLRHSMNGCTQQAKAQTHPHLETCAPVWSPHGKELESNYIENTKESCEMVCGAK